MGHQRKRNHGPKSQQWASRDGCWQAAGHEVPGLCLLSAPQSSCWRYKKHHWR